MGHFKGERKYFRLYSGEGDSDESRTSRSFRFGQCVESAILVATFKSTSHQAIFAEQIFTKSASAESVKIAFETFRNQIVLRFQVPLWQQPMN